MVVARKKDDRIVVGCMAENLINMTDKDLALAENIPFWKVKGEKDCYVFAEHLIHATDLLRYNDYIFKGITDCHSVMSKVVPKMRELLARYSLVYDNDSWDSQLLIVKDGKMFTIGHYFSAIEATDYVAQGYEPYLLGALDENKDMSAEESILAAVRNMQQMKRRKPFPLMLFDGKTKKRKMYYN